MKNRLGDIQIVKNKKPKPNAKKHYCFVRVQAGKREVNLLFTQREIKMALRRAERNPEDLPKIGWLQDLFD